MVVSDGGLASRWAEPPPSALGYAWPTRLDAALPRIFCGSAAPRSGREQAVARASMTQGTMAHHATPQSRPHQRVPTVSSRLSTDSIFVVLKHRTPAHRPLVCSSLGRPSVGHTNIW